MQTQREREREREKKVLSYYWRFFIEQRRVRQQTCAAHASHKYTLHKYNAAKDDPHRIGHIRVVENERNERLTRRVAAHS